MSHPVYLLRKQIERLINEYYPINKVAQMPSNPFWHSFLSGRSGIYILFNKENIIYIGLSNDLGSRLDAHFHSPKYGKEIRSVGIIRMNYEDWFVCATIEASLINKLNPCYNKSNHYLNCKSIPRDFNLDEIIIQIKQLEHKQ